MDQEPGFYQQPLDRTPYIAFIWVIGIAIVLFATAAYAVWRGGSWAKSRSIQASLNNPGATDALLNKIQDQGVSALDQAKDAANKAANDTAANATQQLLQQSNAAVQAQASAATGQVKTEADQQLQQFVK